VVAVVPHERTPEKRVFVTFDFAPPDSYDLSFAVLSDCSVLTIDFYFRNYPVSIAVLDDLASTSTFACNLVHPDLDTMAAVFAPQRCVHRLSFVLL